MPTIPIIESVLPALNQTNASFFFYYADGGKSGSRSPKRVSGDGSAPPRFRFGFPFCSCCLFHGVCLAAASAASRTCLCEAHAMVPK